MSNPVTKWKSKIWNDGYKNGATHQRQWSDEDTEFKVRNAHNEAYQKGFDDGASFEDALDTLEMEIEELPDNQLPSRYSKVAGRGYSLRISAEEEREMLREALRNW